MTGHLEVRSHRCDLLPRRRRLLMAGALAPLLAACGAGDEAVADETSHVPGGPGTPEIAFTSVPPRGSEADLSGRVAHVDVRRVAVAVYIRVANVNGHGYWNKPTWTQPLTRIANDGAWRCDISTGGVDVLADRIVAFLVPAGYVPPLLGGQAELPADLLAAALAQVAVAR